MKESGTQLATNREKYYLGIDPGRDKTGVALVTASGEILAVQVIRTRSFTDALQKFLLEKLQATNFWGKPKATY